MSSCDVLSLKATEEAKWLHGFRSSALSPEGYVVIGRKTHGYCPKRKDYAEDAWQQKAYKLSAIESVLGMLIPMTGALPSDTYISQATFSLPGRRAAGFSRVQSAWVDLDYYDDSHSPSQWSVIKLQRIQTHIQALGLPEPSLIVDSGRGAYVKWIFQSPTHDLPLWNNLQKALTVLFSQLDADFKSKDASRVLRCLQTVNRKNLAPVSVIAGSGKEYDFKAFASLVAGIYEDDVAPHLVAGASAAKRRNSRAGKKIADALERAAQGDMAALSLYKEMREPVMLESLTECSLNWARFSDLRDVVLMRGGFEVGQRNNMLLWMVNCLSHAKVITTANWEREIDDLLKAFPVGHDFQPIETGCLSTLKDRLTFEEHARGKGRHVQRANGLYRPSNEFLIESLGISEQEQRSLRTLIGRDIKNERRRIKRDVTAPGRSTRRDEREAWHGKVHALLQEKIAENVPSALNGMGSLTAGALGINISMLANEIGVDRTVVSKFLKQKISEIFCAKEDFKSEYKNRRRKPAKTSSPKDVNENLGRVDAGAVAVVQQTQKKHRSMLARSESRAREIGKKRLDAAVEKIRSLAIRTSVKKNEAHTATISGVHDRAIDCDSVKQGVEIMPSSGVSESSLVPAPLRAGMFAPSKKVAMAAAAPSRQHVPSVLQVKQASSAHNPSADFYVAAKHRPRFYPSSCTWVNSNLPLNTKFSHQDWELYRDNGRYFVVEVIGEHPSGFCGLLRVINPHHADGTQIVAGQDLYGTVLASPSDVGALNVVKALDGCTLLSTRGKARIPEALEDDACMFFGSKFFVSRAPSDYLAGGQSLSSHCAATPVVATQRALAPPGLPTTDAPSVDAGQGSDEVYAGEDLALRGPAPQ